MKPRLVDLYCCQGGASMGYAQAGFEVVGVDSEPQPRYPFRFVQADALDLLDKYGADFDVRVASPPCQRRTRAQKIQGREHPALIAPTRRLLTAIGGPWAIENVVPDGADDDPLVDPVLLCGAMFKGLKTYRHRLIEANVTISVPPHPVHTQPTVKMGRPLRDGDWYHAVGNFSNVDYVRRNLGVPWMSRDGIRECIPPVYAKHIGDQLMAHLEGRVEV